MRIRTRVAGALTNPASDDSAYPASDVAANPAFDGSACPASDDSACPASDVSANPASEESACPAFEVSAIPGAVKRPRAVVPEDLEIHAPSADDLDEVDPIQKKIKPGSDCPTCGTQFEALIAKGVESAVNKIMKRRDSALEEEVHKLPLRCAT